jgi:hypothetical protein
MWLIIFSCISSELYTHECSCCASTFEVCLEAPTGVVQNGWKLIRVRYRDLEDRYARWWDLPIEAFDGQPMQSPVSQLQQQWEHVLAERI